jgi:3-oxoacyl-[acyl-carrier-protein] synthase-3
MPAVAGVGAWYPDGVRRNEDYPADFQARARKSGQRTFNDIAPSLDPALRVTEEFLLQEAEDPFLGVRERRIAPEGITAVEAEANAARLALDDAGVGAGEIDCVISYSAVFDRPTPPAASGVAQALGIRGAVCWGMDVACAAALVQIATACALVDTGQATNVLLTQSHLMLRTFPFLHPASPGLGDAATALVVTRHGRWPVVASRAVTHEDHYKSVTWVRESAPAEQDPEDTPWWKSGGPFRVGSLDVAGAKALQRDTVAYGAQTLKEVAATSGIDLERIGLLASAEPRGWIPKGILRVLGLDESVAVSVYRDRAHLGASGCIANLERAHRTGKTRGVDIAALYAQGAGFTRAAVLLDMSTGDGAVRQRA